jgi:hypothetical protein
VLYLIVLLNVVKGSDFVQEFEHARNSEEAINLSGVSDGKKVYGDFSESTFLGGVYNDFVGGSADGLILDNIGDAGYTYDVTSSSDYLIFDQNYYVQVYKKSGTSYNFVQTLDIQPYLTGDHNGNMLVITLDSKYIAYYINQDYAFGFAVYKLVGNEYQLHHIDYTALDQTNLCVNGRWNHGDYKIAATAAEFDGSLAHINALCSTTGHGNFPDLKIYKYDPVLRDNTSVYVRVKKVQNSVAIDSYEGIAIFNLDTGVLDYQNRACAGLESKRFDCAKQDDGTEICSCVNYNTDLKNPSGATHHYVEVFSKPISGTTWTSLKKLQFLDAIHQTYNTKVTSSGMVHVSYYQNYIVVPIIVYDSRDDFKVKNVISTHASQGNNFGINNAVNDQYIASNIYKKNIQIYKFNSVTRTYDQYYTVNFDGDVMPCAHAAGGIDIQANTLTWSCNYKILHYDIPNNNGRDYPVRSVVDKPIANYVYGVGGFKFEKYPNTSGHPAGQIASNEFYAVFMGTGRPEGEPDSAVHALRIFKNFGSKTKPIWNKVQEIELPNRYLNSVDIHAKTFIVAKVQGNTYLYKRNTLTGLFELKSESEDTFAVGSSNYLKIILHKTSQGLFLIKSDSKYNSQDNAYEICEIAAASITNCVAKDVSAYNPESEGDHWFGRRLVASGDNIFIGGRFRTLVYRVNSNKVFNQVKILEHSDYTDSDYTFVSNNVAQVTAGGKFVVLALGGNNHRVMTVLDMTDNYKITTIINDMAASGNNAFNRIKCTTNCERIVADMTANRVSVFKLQADGSHALEYQLYTSSLLSSLPYNPILDTDRYSGHNIQVYSNLEVNAAQILIGGYDFSTSTPYVLVYNLDQSDYVHVAQNLVINPLTTKTDREVTGSEIPRSLHKFIKEKPPRRINVPKTYKNLSVKKFTLISMRIISIYSVPAGTASTWSNKKKEAFAKRILNVANRKKTHKIDIANLMVKFLRKKPKSRRMLLEEFVDEVEVTTTYNGTDDNDVADFGTEYSITLPEDELIAELQLDSDFDDFGDSGLTIASAIDEDNTAIEVIEYFDPDQFCKWVVEQE